MLIIQEGGCVSILGLTVGVLGCRAVAVGSERVGSERRWGCGPRSVRCCARRALEGVRAGVAGGGLGWWGPGSGSEALGDGEERSGVGMA